MAVAAASFLAISVAHIPFPLVILAAGLLGWGVSRKYPHVFAGKTADATAEQEEPQQRLLPRLAKMAAIYVVLLAVPVAITIAVFGT